MIYFKLENTKTGWFTKDSSFRSLALIGLGLFIISSVCSFYFEKDFGKSSTTSRWAYGLSSAFIILGLSRPRIKGKGMVTGFFLLLGNASYVLYLIHWPISAMLMEAYARLSLPSNTPMHYAVCALALIGSVGLALIIHKKVEVKVNAWIARRLL